jgi:hypothetical protein
MRFVSMARLACLTALLFAPAAFAADPNAVALGQLIRPLLILPADSAASWEGIEKAPGFRWGHGPVMTERATQCRAVMTPRPNRRSAPTR